MPCDIQQLLDDGRCFSNACLTHDQQIIVELQLLKQWAGYTGTVQELLDAGSCFSNACLTRGQQTQVQLQLLCEINAGLVTCFTLDMSSTDDTGSCDGTATATPVNGVGPYTYMWSDGQTTQTATGLCAGLYSCIVLDLGTGGICADAGLVDVQPAGGCVAVTDAVVYSGGTYDPQAVPWVLVGGTATTVGFDVQVTGSITELYVQNASGFGWYDGTFDFTPLASCLERLGFDFSLITTPPDVTGLPNLTFLGLNDTAIGSFAAQANTSLTDFGLYASLFVTDIDLSGFTSLTTVTISNNPSLTTVNIAGCTQILTITAIFSALDEATVDHILTTLDANGLSNGTCSLNFGTNAAPSVTGAAAAANLIGKGWTVNTN